MLKSGIIGLPNAGKSTLFNALTKSHKAAVANYPFCTIEPNVGVVAVPDPRLDALARTVGVTNIIYATIEFVDIAGLVKGASKGEGLGNKFLSHIREVDSLIHLVRCFKDENVPHISPEINPINDIEIVNTELILSDIEAIQKRIQKIEKDAKRGDKAAMKEMELLLTTEKHLNSGKPANTLELIHEFKPITKQWCLLTDKPTIYVANISDSDIPTAKENPLVQQVISYAKQQHNCDTLVLSAQIEAELADFSPEESADYLKSLGINNSGLTSLIQATYKILGLITFFTFNEKEARAWTIHKGDTAVKAAGTIHSDFERGFIRAEIVNVDDLIKCKSFAGAREKGLSRLEGKDYLVKDGEVIHFRFNV